MRIRSYNTFHSAAVRTTHLLLILLLASEATFVLAAAWATNLKKIRAIGLEAGGQDAGTSETTRKLHKMLDRYEIPDQYASYEGDHLNRIDGRIRTRTQSFFSEHLDFDQQFNALRVPRLKKMYKLRAFYPTMSTSLT